MKKIVKRINSMMFDVAVAPLLLVIIGVPILIIAAVIGLIIVTVRLIKKARQKNIVADNKTEDNDPPKEGE